MSTISLVPGVHLFSTEKLGKPSFCTHCDELIWGIGQLAYKCRANECVAIVHRKCRGVCARNCPLKESIASVSTPSGAAASSGTAPSSAALAARSGPSRGGLAAAPAAGGSVTEIEARHDFRAARFSSPTWCGFCGKFVKEILGKQGFKCYYCSLCVHRRCVEDALQQTCLGASGDLRTPHSSPFAAAAEALRLDFGEIIVLEELYAVVKGQDISCRDGSVLKDCFTGEEVTETVVKQNNWKTQHALIFLKKLYSRGVISPALHESPVFADSSALYRFSEQTVAEMKKALDEKTKIQEENERRDIHALCLRVIDVVSSKAIALADGIAHDLILNSEVSNVASLMRTTFATSKAPKLLADYQSVWNQPGAAAFDSQLDLLAPRSGTGSGPPSPRHQSAVGPGLKRSKAARTLRSLSSDTDEFEKSGSKLPPDVAAQSPSIAADNGSVSQEHPSFRTNILNQIRKEQEAETAKKEVKAFSPTNAAALSLFEASDDETPDGSTASDEIEPTKVRRKSVADVPSQDPKNDPTSASSPSSSKPPIVVDSVDNVSSSSASKSSDDIPSKGAPTLSRPKLTRRGLESRARDLQSLGVLGPVKPRARRDPTAGIAHKELREIIQDLRNISLVLRRRQVTRAELDGVLSVVNELDTIISKDKDTFAKTEDGPVTVFTGTLDNSQEQWPMYFDFNDPWFVNHFQGEDYGAYFGRIGLGAPLVALIKHDMVGISKVVILEDDFPDPSVVQQWRHFSRYVVSLMAPDLNITDLRLLVKPDFDDVFQKFEADDPMIAKQIPVGIVLCKPGQNDEEDFFANTKGSAAYDGFLRCIGQVIELRNFNLFPPHRYTGGLDTSNDQHGKKSVYTVYNGVEVMYQVSSLMPLTSEAFLSKKRFIGNNLVMVVYQEYGCKPYDVSLIPSQFVQIIILVTELAPSEEGYYRFRISVAKLHESIPNFGPPIPFPPIFKVGPELQEFFTQLVVNAHLAACRGELMMTRFKPVYKNSMDSLTTMISKSDTKSEDSVNRLKKHQHSSSQLGLKGFSSLALSSNLRHGLDGKK